MKPPPDGARALAPRWLADRAADRHWEGESGGIELLARRIRGGLVLVLVGTLVSAFERQAAGQVSAAYLAVKVLQLLTLVAGLGALRATPTRRRCLVVALALTVEVAVTTAASGWLAGETELPLVLLLVLLLGTAALLPWGMGAQSAAVGVALTVALPLLRLPATAAPSHAPLTAALVVGAVTSLWVAAVGARHRRAERRTERIEALLRAIVESANDGIIAADAQGMILQFNPSAERIFGYSAGEAIGSPLTILMPERFRDAHRSGLRRFLETGQAQVIGKTLELVGRRKDGGEFPLELSLAASKIGEDVSFTAIVRDVTERRRAEEALRQSEERYRVLTDQVRDYAILMLDLDGNVATWNAGAERMKGYTADEIIGRHFSCFSIPEDLERNRPKKLLAEASARGSVRDEGWRVRKDGSRLWADVTVTALHDAAGALTGFAKVTSDATARRNAEEKVRERTAALSTANQELEAFCYSVSHDLRAPLRAIDGFSRILLEDHADRLDAEGRRLLGVVMENARTMGRLIDDLLAFSRTGRTNIQSSVLDMRELATATLQQILADHPKRKIQASVGPLSPAWGDGALIKQVFVNLLGNAVKYSAARDVATIDVGGSAGDRENTYWVKDNGAGFEMAYAHKLFGVFQRLHSSEEFEGTGVGLALVHRILQRHAGRIWAQSAVDQGATFFFTLPKEGESDGRNE